MSGWQPRLVLVVVAVVALTLSVLLAIRSRRTEVADAPHRDGPPTVQARAEAHAPAKPVWREAGSGGERGSIAADSRADQRGAVGTDAEPAEPDLPGAGTPPGAPSGLPPARAPGAAGNAANGPGDKGAVDKASAGAAAPVGGSLSEAATASGVAPVFAAFGQSSGGGAIASSPIQEENVDFSALPGAYFPPEAVLGYPNRGGLQVEAGTVMFWVQPVDWDGTDNLSYSFFLLRDTSSLDHHFAILKSQVSLRFQIVNADGIEFDVFSPMSDWHRGDWHHVAATWGDSLMDLWVDGELVGEQNVDGIPAVQANSPAYWGSNRGTNGAGAILADGRIFDSVLTAADIQAEAQRVPR